MWLGFFFRVTFETSGSQMVINIHKNISEMQIGIDDLKSWVDIVGDLQLDFQYKMTSVSCKPILKQK